MGFFTFLYQGSGLQVSLPSVVVLILHLCPCDIELAYLALLNASDFPHLSRVECYSVVSHNPRTITNARCALTCELKPRSTQAVRQLTPNL